MIGVTPAAQVLWWFDHSRGYRPGSFMENLIRAIASADPQNRARLALGFPEYVEAMNVAQNMPGGLDRLHDIVVGG